jgi:3'(2'), 5'-bisphosphate nucleotidase
MHNHPLIDIAREAGRRVMAIYQQPDFQVSEKKPGDLLTEADIASHAFIYEAISKIYPGTPIISEESGENMAYETRQHFQTFFLVDPLDGTKEFVKRNGEFTINIALMHENRPIAGVIYAPALDTLYFAAKDSGAIKMTHNDILPLPRRVKGHNAARVVISRSHSCEQTQAFLAALELEKKPYQVLSVGSALKFAMMAEGKADIYPRFSPTMEWDTAAGDILVQETAHHILTLDNESLLSYNKPELINPGFIVKPALRG